MSGISLPFKGDFFGELGALGWGASLWYPRLATVVAHADTNLLLMNDAELAELTRSVPPVARRGGAAATRRKGRLCRR